MSIFIAAEAGTAHGGSPSAALDLAAAAKAAGADAVKFQCWTEPFWTEGDPNGPLFRSCLWDAETWRGLAHRLAGGNHIQMEWFASVFDLGALALMESLGVKRYKIASRSWQDTALIDAVVPTGKPVYISTGMGWPTILENPPPNVMPVYCVSEYPCPDGHLCFSKQAVGPSWGYSHHHGSRLACLVAAARAASYIEIHLKLRGAEAHPDDSSAMFKDNLQCTVFEIRRVEAML